MDSEPETCSYPYQPGVAVRPKSIELGRTNAADRMARYASGNWEAR